MKFNLRLSTMYRQRYWFILMLSLLVACPGVAWGHAHPEQMTPESNATLQQAPEAVKILFTEALEPAFSSLKVTGPQGHAVNQGDSQVDADNPNLLVAPLKSLGPGTYTVHWHVVSRDGHTTEGEYTFQVQ